MVGIKKLSGFQDILCCRNFTNINMHSDFQGGFHLVNLLDTMMTGYPMVTLGLVECLALQYIYGEKLINSIACLV